MPGGGVIFAAILVGWAVFLLPQWLRRDPEIDLDSSVDPTASASDSDRSQTLEELPVRSAHTEHDVDSAGFESTGTDSAESEVTPSSVRERVQLLIGKLSRRPSAEHTPLSAAARRRRVLTVLTLGFLLTGAFAALSFVAMWAPVVTGLLLAGYLVLLTVAGRRRAAQADGLFRTESAESAEFADSDDAEFDADIHADEQLTGPIQVVSRTVEGDAALLVNTEVSAPLPAAEVVTASAFDSSSWAPVQVPLPTYVTKPKARRTIRSIDLSGPGSWTSGRLAPAEAEAYAAAFAEEHSVTPEIVDAQPAEDRDARVIRRVVGE